jgi:hypothetical protein
MPSLCIHPRVTHYAGFPPCRDQTFPSKDRKALRDDDPGKIVADHHFGCAIGRIENVSQRESKLVQLKKAVLREVSGIISSWVTMNERRRRIFFSTL